MRVINNTRANSFPRNAMSVQNSSEVEEITVRTFKDSSV
jgi:hypothetical protein